MSLVSQGRRAGAGKENHSPDVAWVRVNATPNGTIRVQAPLKLPACLFICPAAKQSLNAADNAQHLGAMCTDGT